MIALHVLSVFLNVYVLAVISCGTDHQLQSAMIINTVHQVHKNIIHVYITGKASVENTEQVSYQSSLRLTIENEFFCEPRMPKLYTFRRKIKIPMYPIHANNIM